MSTESERWVPKVHPATREIEAEDPMELVATPVEGDPEVMLECILQEFLWLGWEADQLRGLFDSPDYPVLNQLQAYFGREEVGRRVDELVGRFGALRFHAAVAEDPDPEEEDVRELIQLNIRTRTSGPVN